MGDSDSDSEGEEMNGKGRGCKGEADKGDNNS